MRADGATKPAALRIDGGMAANDWFAQFLADILDVAVERPACHETTALGAARLAGLTLGLWPDLKSVAENWRADARFEPRMAARPPRGAARRLEGCAAAGAGVNRDAAPLAQWLVILIWRIWRSSTYPSS